MKTIKRPAALAIALVLALALLPAATSTVLAAQPTVIYEDDEIRIVRTQIAQMPEYAGIPWDTEWDYSEGPELIYLLDENGIGYAAYFADEAGENVFDTVFKDARPFSEGYAPVANDDGLWGVIDKTGALVLTYQYDWFWGSFYNGRASGMDRSVDSIWSSMGYIDISGEFVIAPQYDWAYDFSDGWARVSKTTEQNEYPTGGFIDTEGNTVMPFLYGWLDDFSEGLAVAAADGSWAYGYNFGYIDKTGETIVPFEYDYVTSFYEGKAYGEKDEIAYMFEKTNLTATPPPASDISVIVDGKTLSFDVPPQITNGRTLVPLRAIFEEIGAAIEWDGDSQTVTAVKGETVVVLTIGSHTPTINGETVTIDQPGVIVNGRTLAPLRFVAEAFGGTVEWDGETQTASISTSAIIR